MTDNLKAFIDGIKRKLENVTPAWDIALGEFHDDNSWPGNFDVHGGKILSYGMDGEEGIYADNAADVVLIASAPQDLTLLCQMLERAVKTLGVLEEIGYDAYDRNECSWALEAIDDMAKGVK